MRMVMSTIGLAVGSMVGAPGIGFAVGSTIGGAIDARFTRATDEKQKGTKPEGIQVQSAAYGIPIPVVYGTMRVAGNVIWSAPIREVQHDDGSWSFYATFAIAVCAGPISKILRVWAGDRLLDDLHVPYDGERHMWTRFMPEPIVYRAYLGTEDQLPDPAIEEVEDEQGATTPAFRGLAYVVFEEFPLALTDNQIPNFTFEVCSRSVASIAHEGISPPYPLSRIWLCDTDELYYPSVDITDLDNDGYCEMVYTTRTNKVQRANRFGTITHQYAAGNEGTLSQGYGFVTCLDVNEDGFKEILWSNMTGRLRCMTATLSSVLWMLRDWWTRHGITPPSYQDQIFYNGPSVVDLDVVGIKWPHLIIGGADGTITCVRASNGTVRWEFNANHGTAPNYTKRALFRHPATVNDANREQPMFYVSRGSTNNPELSALIAIDKDGSTHNATPPDTPDWTYDENSPFPVDLMISRAAWGKVDPDDPNECIVFVATRQEGVNYREQSVYVIDLDGNYKMHRVLNYLKDIDLWANQPVLSYRNYDENDMSNTTLDILISDALGYVYCFYIDGGELLQRWRVRPFLANAFAPCVVDVDGDGKKEVVVVGADQDQFYVLNRDTGVIKQRVDLPYPAGGRGPITAADIDNDGYIEVILPLSSYGWLACFRGGPTSSQNFPHNVFRRSGCNNIRNGYADWDPDLEDFGGRDMLDRAVEDNLVLHPDEIHVTIVVSGVWDRYNLLTKTFDLHADYRLVGGGNPEIPHRGGDFDIDERNVIYTVKDIGNSLGRIVKLDGDTYEVLEEASWHFGWASEVRVSRDPFYPWLAVIDVYGQLLVTNRETLMFPGGVSGFYALWTPLAGGAFVSVDISEGTIWALHADATPGNNRVYRIVIDPSTYNFTTQPHITPETYYGEVLRWDAGIHQLMIGQQYNQVEPEVHFYDWSSFPPPLGTLSHVGSIVGEVMPAYPKSAWRRGTVDGKLYYTSSQGTSVLGIRVIDVEQRAIVGAWDASEELVGWLGGCIYEHGGASIISGCGAVDFLYARIYVGRASPQPPNLDEIVADILGRAGLVASQYDVTALEATTLWGYVVDGRMKARDALQPILDSFFVDGSEVDGKLVFRVRGGASALTIPTTSLAAHLSGDERPQALITSRESSVETPCAFEVVYQDYLNQYEQGVQRATRQTKPNLDVLALTVPFALHPDTAMQMAVKHMGYVWLQRNRHLFSVSEEYVHLDPSDVVTLEDRSRLVRLEAATYQGPIIEMEASDEDPEVYVSNAQGVTMQRSAPGGLLPGPSLLALIDCPALYQSESTPGLYFGCAGWLEDWRGAVVFVSRDGGASWQQWGTTSRSATIGKSLSVLPDVLDPWIWDEGGSVTIGLQGVAQVPTAATPEEVLNGANHAILGDEIIAYRNVLANGDGSYTLSGLLRGRFGTEWATGSHALGETFVVLDTNVTFHSIAIEDRGVELQYAVQSVGSVGDIDQGMVFTAQLRPAMPWAPVDVTGERSDGDLLIAWTRRARYGGGLGQEEVPLCETTEAYEVDVLDGDTVVRTLSSSTPSVAYSAAEQTTDFGSPQGAVSIRVYQISTEVGRGFPASATV